MSALAALEKTALSALHDPRLFREYAYADGRWIAAPDGAEIDVTNPADGTRVWEGQSYSSQGRPAAAAPAPAPPFGGAAATTAAPGFKL